MQKEPINLYWTGGFDSTFRLLSLLVVEEATVQSYYIIDSSRSSTIHELKAMEIIKGKVIKKFPKTKSLFLSPILYLKNDILLDPQMSRYYKNIKSNLYISPQYEWLASFAHQFGISEMEYCMEKIEHVPDYENHYRSILLPELEGTMHDCKLRNNPINENNCLFKNFRFPVVHLTKDDMRSLSEEFDFYDIIRDAWFCHRPTTQDKPCGICVPCKVRIASGVESQVPYSKIRFLKKNWHSTKDKMRKIRLVRNIWLELKKLQLLSFHNPKHKERTGTSQI